MQKTRIKHRGIRIGDMRHRIKIHDRSITAPVFGSIDFDEEFDGVEVAAAIKTTGGKIFLDGVGQDINATHEIFVRFDSTITSERFIQVEDGRRFRILDVENYDERSEYLRLIVTDRGIGEAAKS